MNTLMKTRVLVPLIVLVVCLVFVGSAVALPSEHPFEIVPGSFSFKPSSDGAGQHADWITSFDFAHEGEFGATYGDVREIVVNLPAGFVASDTAVPVCTQAQLLAINPVSGALADCPKASQLGDLSLELVIPERGGQAFPFTFPVYNMEVNSFGTTAELGYKTVLVTGLLQVQARPGDLGLTARTINITPVGETRNVVFDVWGVPAAPEHDFMRGAICGEARERPAVCHNEYGGPQPAGIPAVPFLSNPTSCGEFEESMEADSWEVPLAWSRASDNRVGPITECDRVPFEPTIQVNPSSRAAESPTGLGVTLTVPQSWENPSTLASANLKDTRVTLPEGVTANPSLAAGLGACSQAQYEHETASSLPGEGCPPESKIGTITIETPLLSEQIKGAVYIATPYDNIPEFGDPEHPGGSLLALYVVAKEPRRGILVKVAGKVAPNPVTGQLVTTFEGTPQQPFSHFKLEFTPRKAAPLVTPAECGSYGVPAQLTPWSAGLEEAPLSVESQPFAISEGAGGGACPSGGVPPFKPQVISGTQNNAGSSFSPFYLRIDREDGEQELIHFSTTLPPGLTGDLSGIPFCPNADIEAAKGVTGAEEEANPSCPAASRIGHSLVEAGVGSVLAQNPGEIYLAGPYNGAPLSIVSITSAKVGPFDLGTVVIRFALDINPTTAQVEVSGAQSDPIPHIIEGIVVHVRNIRVYMDRPDFTINPTNCEKLGITDAITGSGSDYANPANEDTVSVDTPFEAADCSSLTFKPDFQVSTVAKTSRADGASLTAKLTVPAALGSQTNIKEVKVELPKQLPSRLTTLQKACTAEQFDKNPAGCPPASIIGHAKAITPILPVPLEGPAYFVSHGGEAFPDLEIVLQGYGFTIDLTATTFISKAGITSSTFKTIPDQPVTSFELTLPEGPYSALTALGNLCAATTTTTVKKKVTVRIKGHRKTETRKVKETQPASLAMPTAFVGQNGAEIHQSTPIGVTGCAKSKPAKKTRKHKQGKNGKA
jgi:hypothetical protein